MFSLLRMLLGVLAPLMLLACSSGSPGGEKPPLEGAALGGPFTLVDKNGDTVTWDDLRGEYAIIYFGYTFCPDACPFDVQAMMMGYNRFAKAHPDLAAKVQPVFISIDPERDTPKVVGQWTAAFSPRLLGLTGTPDQVKTAADAFATYYKKGEETEGGYLMDHSRVAFLMSPEGDPIAMLPVEKGVADKGAAVAAELEKWVR
ncbi:SCO family protein [Novosphingobium sp. PC22D]|uniref:SCO family protein n=1 Tax=Novosphingobium sp. PC22D TaxID=1962403 RepID=UPI001F0A65DE|nr:SCO family protein [Novosphingobium sp. PC22D]